MDTLSSSVSALGVSPFPLPPRDFKSPFTCHHLCTSKPNPISTTFLPHNLTASAHSSSSSHPFSTLHSSPRLTHRKPATGYAAALIDIAQSNASLHLIREDVKKLLKNERLEAAVGGSDKFNRYLVGLVKMLIERKKAEIIVEVLQEFERIYQDMTIGTKLVLGSSAKMMGEKLSNVKIRNLFDESFSFV